MQSTITLSRKGTGTFFDVPAQAFLYGEHREALESLLKNTGDNRYWVFESVDGKPVCRAGQTTRKGAEKYMNDKRVLVWIEEDEVQDDIRAAIVQAEAALGENLVWLTDKLDLMVRQHDPEALRRLEQLNQAWIALAKALKQ